MRFDDIVVADRVCLLSALGVLGFSPTRSRRALDCRCMGTGAIGGPRSPMW